MSDSGNRSDTTTSLYPPFNFLWEKCGWNGPTYNSVPASNGIICNGYFYFGDGNYMMGKITDPSYIWAWDIYTGVTRTGYPLGPVDGAIITVPVIGNDRIYVGTRTNKIYAFDINTHAPIAGFPLLVPEGIIGRGITFWHDKIYFCTYSAWGIKDHLYVHNADSGILVYSKELESSKFITGFSGTPVIWNGRVYVGGTGKIFCWNADTGANVPYFPAGMPGAEDFDNECIIKDGIIYIGSDDGEYFFAINAMTGELITGYPLDIGQNFYTGINEAGLAAVWENKIFFYEDYKLNGIFPDGSYISGFQFSAPGILPITANGLLYFVTFPSNKLTAYDVNNGNIIWESASIVGCGSYSNYDYHNYITSVIADNVIITMDPYHNVIFAYGNPAPSATQTVTCTATYTFIQTPINTFTPTPTKTINEEALQLNLKGNFPNPQVLRTYIIYEINKDANINIKIFSESGEIVYEIITNGKKGKNSVYWDGFNKSGWKTASGIYLYSVEAKAGNEKDIKWNKIAAIR